MVIFVVLVLASISASSGAQGDPALSCPAGSPDGCVADEVISLLQMHAKVTSKVAQHETSEVQISDEIIGSAALRDLEVLPEDRAFWQMTFIETEGHTKPDIRVRYQKEFLHAMIQKQPKSSTLDSSSLEALDDVLDMAVEKTGDKEVDSALEEIEEKVVEGGDVSSLVVGNGKDHAQVMKAIEEVSVEMSPEEALAKSGEVVSSKLLRQLNSLPDTPEQVPETSTAASAVVQGDMVADSKEESLMLLQMASNGTRFVSNLWKNNMAIPYCFSWYLAPSSKKAFQDAVQHYHNHIPCVAFKEVAVGDEANEKCAEQPGIFVKSNEGGCFARVGQPYKRRSGEYGKSYCHLDPKGCATMGIAAHEIGHNIGMMHEQSRTDHGYHVQILWDNIKPDKKDQYDLTKDADTTVPYDVMSLMHYGDDDFGKTGWNGKLMKTMQFIGPSYKTMGNRMGLTQADAKQIARMYGCESKLTDFKLCTEKADSVTTEPCICHTGSKMLKKKFANGYQCVKRCPDYAIEGTPYYCGCPEGCTKKCFTQKGTKYCGCKDCNTPAPPPPAPVASCKDKYSNCAKFSAYCSPHGMLDGKPIMTVCEKTCCSGPCTGCTPPCTDLFKATCEQWGNTYCDNPYSKIGGKPYKEACKKTCGVCW